MIPSLYIHIPFCEKICNYCDFAKVLSSSSDTGKYIDRLLNEISSLNIKDDSLETVYIGGGTPTCLNNKGLTRLLSYLHDHFPHLKEFTIEGNPESLTHKKAALLKKYGVNRVSLGVQSANEETLKYLGRNHNLKDVIEAVSYLRECGIDNINLDFIYGLPKETTTDLKKDIDFALSLNPTHLSFYALQIEESTIFYNRRLIPLDDDMERDLYDYLRKVLREHGYSRYEVSNFSKPNFESLHNKNYWHDGQYYAAGLSASGYVVNERYTDTRSLTRYMNGFTDRKKEVIDEETEEFEFLMLNLRLEKGFELEEFSKRFQKDFLKSYAENIDKVRDSLLITDKSVAIIPDKLYIMDNILLDLLKLPDDNSHFSS